MTGFVNESLGLYKGGANLARLFWMILLMNCSSSGLVSSSFAFFNFITFYFSPGAPGLFPSIVLSF